MTIRVLVADDQSLVRAGFRMLFSAEEDIEVVAEAGNGLEAIEKAARFDPDVVLMDIRMPELDGLAATRQILAADEEARILILTTFDLDEYVYEALRAGASGFVLKDEPPEALLAAIRTIAAGDALLSPTVTRRVIEEFTRIQRPDPPKELDELRALKANLLELTGSVVRLRAQAMQEAVPQGEGAMAAIMGLDDDAVRTACAEAAQGQVVEAVNFNAPNQVVIAGHAPAVERAIGAAKAKGAKRTVRLPVSAPFHSSLLAPAAARLRAHLEHAEGVLAGPPPTGRRLDVLLQEILREISTTGAKCRDLDMIRTVMEARLVSEQLREQVAALAVAGAEKILRREVDAKAHADLLDSIKKQL